MVDFQSRDTRRGVSTEDDDEDEEPDETDVAAEPDATEGTDAAGEPDAGDEDAGTGREEAAAEPDEPDEGDGTTGDGSAATTGDAAAGSVPGVHTDDVSEAPAAPQTDDDAKPPSEVADGPDGSAHDAAGAAVDRAGHHRGDDAGDHGSHDAHDHGPDVGRLGVAVVTVTSSRSRENDTSGDAIATMVEDADHEVVTRDVVADDLDGVQRAVLSLTGRDDVDAVVTTGGTGVTPDDVTVEAVEPLLDKHLPGFGELFRVRSYEEVGSRAISTRATAGISAGVPVFCLPGSENAVRLGMEELVVPEVAHLVGLAREG